MDDDGTARADFCSISREEMIRTSSAWNCMRASCKAYGRKNGGFANVIHLPQEEQDQVAPLQLPCHHLICTTCANTCFHNGMPEVRCEARMEQTGGRCPQILTQTIIDGAPRVAYILRFSQLLGLPGLPCCGTTCQELQRKLAPPSHEAGPAPRPEPVPDTFISRFLCVPASVAPPPVPLDEPLTFPRDVCYVCVRCSADAVTILCTFCRWAMDRAECGPGHVLVRAVELERPLHEVDDRPRNRLLKKINQMSTVTDAVHARYLAYLPLGELDNFMDKILGCDKCRKGHYGHQSDRHPVIVDCGHVVCSICATAGTACPFEGCGAVLKCSAPMDQRSRPDLQFALLRKPDVEHATCDDCTLLHAADFCNTHAMPDAPTQECHAKTCQACLLVPSEARYKHDHA